MPAGKIVYRERFLYRIDGFFPVEHLDIGAYGFSVELDKNLANRALQTELTESGYKNLMKLSETLIQRVWLSRKGERVRPPLHFVANKEDKLTCLLQFCTVPGDACDLGIDGMETGRFVERGEINRNITYCPHNVDNPRQAYALLSVWLSWQDHIEVFLADK